MLSNSSIEKALNVDIPVNSLMVDALEKWTKEYSGDSAWLNNDVKSLLLGATIAGEIAGDVTIEMKIDVIGENARAKYLNDQVRKVEANIQRVTEFGEAKGGIILKPRPDGKKIAVDYIQADEFFPISFDSDNNLTSVIFTDQISRGGKWFTRLEFHYFDDEGKYNIKNFAFKSDNKDTIGSRVQLSSVPEWSDMADELPPIDGLDKPLFGYFRVPLANHIDPSSPLGVSCYSRAMGLIEEADKQYSRLLWEFESGERALYVDETAFDRDSSNKPILPNRRLMRTLKGTGGITENLFEDWTPTIREGEILNGLDAILSKIEKNVGLAFGTLVINPTVVAKTATEIKQSKQRTYLTITNNQKALRTAIVDLVDAMDAIASLYKLGGKGDYEIGVYFDDSIVTDKDSQFAQDSMSLNQSTMGRVEFRVRNYGEDEETAKKKIAEIDEEKTKSRDLFQFPDMVEE